MVRRILTCCGVAILAGCFLSCRTAEFSTHDQEKAWLAKGYRYDDNGWIFLHIEGGPFERGFQRGYLTDFPAQPWTMFPREDAGVTKFANKSFEE